MSVAIHRPHDSNSGGTTILPLNGGLTTLGDAVGLRKVRKEANLGSMEWFVQKETMEKGRPTAEGTSG